MDGSLQAGRTALENSRAIHILLGALMVISQQTGSHMFLPRDGMAMVGGSSIPGRVRGSLLAAGPMLLSFGWSQSQARALPFRPVKPKFTSTYKVWWFDGPRIARRFAQTRFDRNVWWACASPTTNEPHSSAGKTGNAESRFEGRHADSHPMSEAAESRQDAPRVRLPWSWAPTHWSRKPRKPREPQEAR